MIRWCIHRWNVLSCIGGYIDVRTCKEVDLHIVVKYSGNVVQDGTPFRSCFLLDNDKYECSQLQYIMIQWCIHRWNVLSCIGGYIDVRTCKEVDLLLVIFFIWNFPRLFMSCRLVCFMRCFMFHCSILLYFAHPLIYSSIYFTRLIIRPLDSFYSWRR